MTARTSGDYRWLNLTRPELIALGKALVTERLESLGCTVKAPSSS